MFNLKYILIVICLVLFVNRVHLAKTNDTNDTLVMVSVLFRHGDRTIEEITRYPFDTYTDEHYYPYGIGQLTNAGKQRLYLLGKELRRRYKNFLNDTYTSDMIYARTSDYDRTKSSLMLLLTGLFPPTDILKWNDNLNWNPIPFHYTKAANDKDFLAIFIPEFRQLLIKHMKSNEYQLKIKNDTYLMKYIEKHTGLPMRNYIDLTKISDCLITQNELGFTLPAWSKSIFPETLKQYYILGFLDLTATDEMIRFCGGNIFNTILSDNLAKIYGTLPKNRKLYLHSGHDINIVCLLRLFGLYDNRHTPSYGAYMLIELHNVNNEYGFKVYYQTGDDKPVLMKLRNCDDYFCKLDDIIKTYKSFLPN